jgi:hypothetical protein
LGSRSRENSGPLPHEELGDVREINMARLRTDTPTMRGHYNPMHCAVKREVTNRMADFNAILDTRPRRSSIR